MAALAIDGGPPVRRDPFPPRVQIGQEELEAATRVLRASMEGPERLFRYAGEEADSLEREWAESHGVRYAAAVSSGTAAVHTALAAGMLDAGSEVITPPVTDPGGVNPILFQHLIPIFADLDPDTFNLDPASIEERITERTRAIIAVHLAGQPCDMDAIMELAEQHDLLVIEDCSQAHGARYRGRLVGTIGHLGAFSLMGGKHLTAGGEGGVVLTNDEELYWNAKRFADKGKGFNLADQRNVVLGLNYRITELQAAIGREQLKKLPDIVAKRRALANRLREGMAGLTSVHFWKIIEGAEPSYWFCFLRLDSDGLCVSKERFAEAVRAEGVPLGGHYSWLLYDFPYFQERATFGASGAPWTCFEHSRDLDYRGSCPNAEQAIARHMTLHLHECWTEREVDDTVAALAKVERHYARSGPA
ncbi:MAG: DegT/DnrJ/EryC1/StrS family aminotransferase [Armatimonadota bacterium]